ncbi:MAG TPA: SOS response-associated peptidase, partial [Acidimicrobiales bacterium]|nr:SOS response-associated peptidase [Acidimicrobiales bacterium]
MCGRIALFTPPTRLARLLEASLAAGLETIEPSWNIGPLRHLLAAHESDAGRLLERYRWGLVPSWAKDPSIANRLFNARAETVAEKPSFRSAFAKRPCVIPVDGFYEWDHRPGRAKAAHYFHRSNDEPVLLAGLFEHWRDPANEAVLATCTVITTTPNSDMDELHDRMPVVLAHHDVDEWLDVDNADRALLLR